MKTLLIGMKSYLVNLLISLVAIGILLPGCASTGGLGGGLGDYSVGPKRDNSDAGAAPEGPTMAKPFMVVPVFDPNIPDDKAKIEKLAIWPEVRRTEAVRSAVTLDLPRCNPQRLRSLQAL